MIGLAAGFLAARRLWPGRLDVAGAALSLASALGVASLLQYAWLVAGRPGLVALAALECAALGAALALPRAPASAAATDGAPPAPRALRALLVVACGAAAIAMVHTFREFPHGAWDAVDIWNQRAVGFVRAGLGATLATARHADYPLLLSLVVAHGWAWTGPSEPVPMAVAAAFAASTAGILAGTTARLAGPRAAALVAIVLVASPLWAFQAASQRADVPLSCFVLGAAAALALHSRTREPRLLVLAGVQLGCALWTKNEGALLAVALGGAWLVAADPSARRGAWRIALGAAPFVVALLHHKLTCGGTNDLVAGQGASTWERLGEAGRWLATAAAFAREGVLYAGIGGALLVILAREPARGTSLRARFLWAALAVVVAGDFAVYVTTPRDLAWHLGSSLDRVLLQAWPLALLAVVATAPGRTPARQSRVHQRGRNTTGIDSQPCTNSVRMRRSSRSFTA